MDYLDLLKQALTGSLYDESSWERVITTTALKRFMVDFLARRSMALFHMRPYNSDIRAEGKDWPGIGYTMIGHRRLDNLRFAIDTIEQEGIPGDVMETGVWRGGASIFMRACLKVHGSDRRLWVADSFEGMPKPSCPEDAGYDISGVDVLRASLEDVKRNFERFEMLDDNVHFLKGWFHDTLPHAPIDRLALLRLDGDLYKSTMDALDSLYDKVSPGGFLVIDDYYSWEPCRRAVKEFRKTRGITAKIIKIDWTGAYWRVPN